MTYEQYWDGDPDLTRYFSEAYEMEMERKNRLLMQEGAYFYDVLMRVAPALRAFSKTPPMDYRTEVIPLTAKEKREVEQAEERHKMEASRAAMMEMMIRINRERAKNGK